jgi:hypothetical protein
MIRQLLAGAGVRRGTIDALVRQVAEASVEVVCRMTADQVIGMGPCEARGYIRGRAGREIRRQARVALSRHMGVDAAAAAAIVARAADRVPSLVLRRLTAAFQRVAAPQRRAA